MKEFHAKVAVVTGAASGIGFALATALAAEGMSIVMADIIEGELAESAAQLQHGGATVLGVVTDVADEASVHALAAAAHERFGNVDMLCSNAGVSGPPTATMLDTANSEWHRVLGVNFFGFVNCVREFVPRMHQSGRAGNVVVTASIASFTLSGFAAPYFASKHALMSAAASLRATLAAQNSLVKVSLLCPNSVASKIRDHEIAHSGAGDPVMENIFKEMMGAAMNADTMASMVLEAIRQDRFYVFTHDDTAGLVTPWFDEVLAAMPVVDRRNRSWPEDRA